MTRTARLLALLGALALLSTGCGTAGASPGAAAVVGGTPIPMAELRGIVDRGLADSQFSSQPGNDRASFQLQVLNRLVRAALLEVAAKREGVVVTPGDVDAFLAQSADQVGGRQQLDKQAAASGIASPDLPGLVRAIVLQQKIGEKLTAGIDVPQAQLQQLYDARKAQYDQVRARHILVKDEATARDLLAKVQADPGSFAALAKQYSIDTSNKDQGGELGWQGRGAFVPAFDQVVFSAPVGSFTLVQTQYGWHVVQVEARKNVSLAEATPELRRQALAQQMSDAVQTLIRDVAGQQKVTVNPRFGRWDDTQLQVIAVPANDGLSSPAGSPGVSAPPDAGLPGPGAPPAPGGGQPPASPAPSR